MTDSKQFHICANREECLFSDYADGLGECPHSHAHIARSACVCGGVSGSDCINVSELDPEEGQSVTQEYEDRLFMYKAIMTDGYTLKPCHNAVRREERGWPGHFILGHKCIFHRNTLLTFRNLYVVVSTVGNLPDEVGMECNAGGTMQEIGPGRYFETSVFHSNADDQYYHDADTTRWIPLLGPWRVTEHGAGSDLKANQMHDDAVQEIIDRMLRGERFEELNEEVQG